MKAFAGQLCDRLVVRLRAILLAAVGSVLAACSSAPVVKDFAYYGALTQADVESEVVLEEQGDVVVITAPLVADPLNWGVGDLRQQHQLQAHYNVKSNRLQYQWLMSFELAVKTKLADTATVPEYDRARVNAGNLQFLREVSSVTKSCDKKFCRYSQSMILPLAVADVRDSRYKGLFAELIKPGGEPLAFGLPDPYMLAFNAQVEQVLEQNFTDFTRVEDGNAPPSLRSGRDQLQVEAMAKEWSCKRTSVQVIQVDGVKTIFQVECGGDLVRTVECQWGQCQARSEQPF